VGIGEGGREQRTMNREQITENKGIVTAGGVRAAACCAVKLLLCSS